MSVCVGMRVYCSELPPRSTIFPYTTYAGKVVDLGDFVIARRTQLVLKPNDEYGGKGVVLGWTIDQHEWEQSFLAALASSYVVRERVPVPRYPFPVVLDPMHFLYLS